MNCGDFEKLVLALARQHLVDAESREQGLSHAELCNRCANRLTQERALIAGVRAAAAEIAGEEAPPRVELALLAAFREAASATADAPLARRGRRWQRGVVAAGILLLLSIVGAFWLTSGSPSRQRALEAIVPALPENPAPVPVLQPSGRDDKMAQHRVTPQRQRRARHQAAEQNVSEAEIVTEFFPLLEGDDLNALESTQIVRVELPGSALLEAGLPVDARTASEPVKADVVLGPDGMARAIRFVR